MSLTENHTIAELLYENGKLSAELEAERFMLELITSLSSTELIDDGINNVLCKVGEYTCADRAYVLETGNIVLSGDAKEMMNNDSIKKAYLGE